MHYRTLGTTGPLVSAIGFGAMALVNGMYGSVEETSAIRIMQQAMGLGVNFIDTADAYANGSNEAWVGRAIQPHRDGVVVASKFGIVFDPGVESRTLQTKWSNALPINGTPRYARQALDATLQRLGTDYLDIWYLHFPDPAVPIEETVGAMSDAVTAGTVRHLALSNVTAGQVRRAHQVHPIVAVQYEYSLWARKAEVEVLPTTKELGIGFVPWAPLGSGFLTGEVQSIGEVDFRNNNPRFRGENLRTNFDRFAPIRQLAEDLSVTPAQLALVWLLHQGQHVVPIPGTRNPAHLEQNLRAADIPLTTDVLRELGRIAPHDMAVGSQLL